MIRTAKPRSQEALRRERLAAIQAEIAALETPSPLGAAHDAHVRPRRNGRIAALRTLEEEVRREARAQREAGLGERTGRPNTATDRTEAPA